MSICWLFLMFAGTVVYADACVCVFLLPIEIVQTELSTSRTHLGTYVHMCVNVEHYAGLGKIKNKKKVLKYDGGAG